MEERRGRQRVRLILSDLLEDWGTGKSEICRAGQISGGRLRRVSMLQP